MTTTPDKLPAKPLKIFVNYRRADEKIFVELLRTHFMWRYGRENVFMDFDSLPPFTNFDDFIRQKVRECDVVVMMIGKRWLELLRQKEAAGDPDYVRIELEEALAHGKLIAPICILDASMVTERDLPESLRPISKINAEFISDGRHLLDDVQRIMDFFERTLAERGATREVSNPTSQTSIEAVQDSAGRLDLNQVLKRFAEAQRANDLPQALVWLGQLRASGQAIPPTFELDKREANLQARLREEEERRRRREVADFQYTFVRFMLDLDDPPEQIRAAVEDIWRVEPGYIPDDLRRDIRRLMGLVREPTLGDRMTDEKGIPMVYVPAGKFLMGSTEAQVEAAFQQGKKEYNTFEREWVERELPQHEVIIASPFWLDLTPVTNAAYAQFVKEKGYENKAYWTPAGWQWVQANNKRGLVDDPDHSSAPNQPRVGVTWFEAYAYCQWRGGRLPTEAEWEWAARGPESRVYPWGNKFVADYVIYADNSGDKTAPVGDGIRVAGASWVGALDMSGNVWEWCHSLFQPYPYRADDGRNSIDNNNRTRVLRGGSWSNDSTNLRAAYRLGGSPAFEYSYLAFRFARSS